MLVRSFVPPVLTAVAYVIGHTHGRTSVIVCCCCGMRGVERGNESGPHWKPPRRVHQTGSSLNRLKERASMKSLKTMVLICLLTAFAAVPVIGQVHKFFSPGTVWTVTMIKMAPGMDQSYMEYLDGQFKKGEDAQVKAGFEKSYKVLRTLDDGGAWNLLILREYTSLASVETNAEKSDAVAQQTNGNDQAQMQGYQDRAKYREVVGTKYARELLLK